VIQDHNEMLKVSMFLRLSFFLKHVAVCWEFGKPCASG